MPLVIALLAGLGTSVPAPAQTAPSPDDMLQQALGHWRAASWYVRLGDDNVTGIEIDAFRIAWENVASLSPNARPPSHSGDPQWPATVTEISALADTAVTAIDGDDEAGAAQALTKIGDALAASRQRAGTTGFPDVVRRYRDAVERLSGLVNFNEQRQGASFDAARRAEVRAAAVDCASAVATLMPAIPPRWAHDAKLEGVIRQNVDGIRTVLAELDRQPPASGLEIAAAINVARSNYYLLFLNYGALPPRVTPA